jgi:hypothetical protein
MNPRSTTIVPCLLLLLHSLTPDGKEDAHSLHGSCPTTKVRDAAQLALYCKVAAAQAAACEELLWTVCCGICQHGFICCSRFAGQRSAVPVCAALCYVCLS